MNKNDKMLAENILKKLKKVALTGTAMAMLAGVFVASGGTQVSAAEFDERAVPISEVIDSAKEVAKIDVKKKSIFSLFSFQTNDDIKRRAALEEAFDVELDDELDVWADKYQEDRTYTSHDALKVLDSYALNASRQELIKFGIRTGDWQPYDAFSAMERPAFYEYIDGKFVKNKFYYGWLIESQIRSIRSLETEIAQRIVYYQPLHEESSDVKADEIVRINTRLQELVEDYKKAPGVVPYVVGFNSNLTYAKEFDVEQPGSDFYNSRWNHPDVMAYGNFSLEERQKQAKSAADAKKLEEAKKASESTINTNEKVEDPAA